MAASNTGFCSIWVVPPLAATVSAGDGVWDSAEESSEVAVLLALAFVSATGTAVARIVTSSR